MTTPNYRGRFSGSCLPRIREPLHWDDHNVEHLWRSHQASPEEACYRQLRDGDYFRIYGETGSGRVLKRAGEFMSDGRFRVFAAQDMDAREKRAFRNW